MRRPGSYVFASFALVTIFVQLVTVQGWRPQIHSLSAIATFQNSDENNNKTASSSLYPAGDEDGNHQMKAITCVVYVQNIISRVRTYIGNHRYTLWFIPIIGCLVSFHTFTETSRFFHDTVQWASHNTWLPERMEDINLQANVVTQVVNGPVITSISLLFAVLVSITVQNLHSGQSDIQKSFVMEKQALRMLHHAVECSSSCLSEIKRVELLKFIQEHSDRLVRESSAAHVEVSKEPNPDAYIQANMLTLLTAIYNNELSLHLQLNSHLNKQNKELISRVQRCVDQILKQRSYRWLALRALHFPPIHYITLALLAIGIAISFLVATDEAEFIFLKGLPVRILWTVLCTSFSALATLCFDLSRPFGGAYRVQQ